mmetsp:Transcript_55993/g.103579  ORF Transcript_55993/g.103579 Transcript_55993/m.103579 type:complete len:517 (-) Transcript_55993:81-1631(-)
MAAADPVFEALGLKQVEPAGFRAQDVPMPCPAPVSDVQAYAGQQQAVDYAQQAAAQGYYGAWPQQANNAWNTYVQAAAACAAAFQALSFASTSTQGAMAQAAPAHPQQSTLVLPDFLPSDASRANATSYNGATAAVGMSTPVLPWGSTAQTQSQWQAPTTWSTAPPTAPNGMAVPCTTTTPPAVPAAPAAAPHQVPAAAESHAMPVGLPLQRIADDSHTPGTPSRGNRGCAGGGDSEKENAPVELNLAERTAPPSPGFLAEHKERKGTPLSLLNSLSPPFSDGPPQPVSLFELTPPPKLRSLAELADVPCFVPSPGWEQALFMEAPATPEKQAEDSGFDAARTQLLTFRSVVQAEGGMAEHSIPGQLKAKSVSEKEALVAEPAAPKQEVDPKGAEAGAMLLQLVKGNPTAPVAGKGLSRGEIRAKAAAARAGQSTNALAILFPDLDTTTDGQTPPPVSSRRRRSGRKGASWYPENSDSPASEEWLEDTADPYHYDDRRSAPRVRTGRSGARAAKHW